MTKTILLGTSAIAALAIAAPAYAQDAQPTQNSQAQAQPGSQPGDTPQPNAVNPQSEVQTQTGQPADQGANSGGIIVTGSRIRRPNLSSPVPITSVTAEDLPDQGQASIGDALNDLPSLRSTFSQQNSGEFIGTAGQNFLDLRGLGTNRTLVLVNGRRHITASPGVFDSDVNTIPQDLIERIDIVTGGEAAVYGSDAVAGVVNFVLKRNFDGLRFRMQDGVSSRGDRPVQVATLTAGRNFADGRGNIAVSLEYTSAAPLYTRDRDALTGAFSGRCQFQLTERITGEPAAGDGIPDRTFLCGIRNATISNGGTIGEVNAAGDFLRFDNNGNLFVDHPTQSFVPIGSGNQQGGAGSTLEDTGQLAVGQKRYVANLLAHFDVSEALKPFVEATFVHQRVVQEGQPTFFSGFGVNCDNGFLTNANRATLQANGFCVDNAGAFDPNAAFPISRFNVDFGGRGEIDTRNTFRIVGGIEGDFNSSWHYELSANYGRFQSTVKNLNDLKLADLNGNPDGFLLAVDAVQNAAGQVVCRVNQVAVTRPDCVPIDIFGDGKPSAAALGFVNVNTFLWSQATEFDLVGFVSGDTGKWFKLPGGPVGFSIGGEYRRETAASHADPLSASNATFFNAFLPFRPPAFAVKEVYGELNLPLIKDIPLIHELTLSGAARYSDYNTSAGHTFAWNLNGVYAPVSDFRFRANYSKSVRVPTLADLFSPNSVNFNFVQDPCDQAFINSGNPTRAANCAALGVPTTVAAGSTCAQAPFNLAVGSPFQNCIANSQSIQFLQGGNPTLKPETGRSLTLGGVLTPRFLPGFSLTVDYYNIKVTNLIALLSAQQILDLCVDAPTINNQFCPLIGHRDASGLLATPNALLSSGVNFAKQKVRGLDFDLAYRHTFADGSRINVRGIMTLTLELNDFTDPTNPNLAFHQLDVLGDPALSGNLTLGYGRGPWDLSWTVQWIGRQLVNTYEGTHTFQGNPPSDPDFASVVWYPNVYYHNVRFSYKVNNHYRLYLGVDNLFDKMPPYNTVGTAASATTGGISPWSDIGRFYYGGVQVDF